MKPTNQTPQPHDETTIVPPPPARLSQHQPTNHVPRLTKPTNPTHPHKQSFLLSSLAHALLPHLSLVSSDAVALHPLALVGLCGAIASAFAALPIGAHAWGCRTMWLERKLSCLLPPWGMRTHVHTYRPRPPTPTPFPSLTTTTHTLSPHPSQHTKQAGSTAAARSPPPSAPAKPPVWGPWCSWGRRSSAC